MLLHADCNLTFANATKSLNDRSGLDPLVGTDQVQLIWGFCFVAVARLESFMLEGRYIHDQRQTTIRNRCIHRWSIYNDKIHPVTLLQLQSCAKWEVAFQKQNAALNDIYSLLILYSAWESWLQYVLTATDWDSNGATCMSANKKTRHCMLSTNRTYWGIPVSFLRSWQLISTENTASNFASDMTIQSNPVRETY